MSDQLVDENMVLDESNSSTSPAININTLPDEILENIFGRISPYNDFDSIAQVCHRWNNVSRKLVNSMINNFEQSLKEGRVQCVGEVAEFNEDGRLTSPWISERFGHMCCYYDKQMYVVGGTTNTPTTFNDMWKFDLSTRTFSRVIVGGQYPTPKALATFVNYKGNLILFGGWSHPAPYPLLQPWRIFDELHIYDVANNKWTLKTPTSRNCPPPSAGHSASIHGSKMIVFGGRTFELLQQSYPISKSVWVFDILDNEWYLMRTKCHEGDGPMPRYGHTQIAIDESNLLIIGGIGGPNNIFSDVWLLTFLQEGSKRYSGTWKLMTVENPQEGLPLDFHFAGVKVGDNVIFYERASPISPFLAFLHFESKASLPPEQNRLVFEQTRSRTYFQSRCSGLRRNTNGNVMRLYSLDINKALTENVVSWRREPTPLQFSRPDERLLYSLVPGRAELLLFGGFYKEANSFQCRVSNDVYILKSLHKNY